MNSHHEEKKSEEQVGAWPNTLRPDVTSIILAYADSNSLSALIDDQHAKPDMIYLTRFVYEKRFQAVCSEQKHNYNLFMELGEEMFADRNLRSKLEAMPEDPLMLCKKALMTHKSRNSFQTELYSLSNYPSDEKRAMYLIRNALRGIQKSESDFTKVAEEEYKHWETAIVDLANRTKDSISAMKLKLISICDELTNYHFFINFIQDICQYGNASSIMRLLRLFEAENISSENLFIITDDYHHLKLESLQGMALAHNNIEGLKAFMSLINPAEPRFNELLLRVILEGSVELLATLLEDKTVTEEQVLKVMFTHFARLIEIKPQDFLNTKMDHFLMEKLCGNLSTDFKLPDFINYFLKHLEPNPESWVNRIRQLKFKDEHNGTFCRKQLITKLEELLHYSNKVNSQKLFSIYKFIQYITGFFTNITHGKISLTMERWYVQQASSYNFFSRINSNLACDIVSQSLNVNLEQVTNIMGGLDNAKEFEKLSSLIAIRKIIQAYEESKQLDNRLAKRLA